jgi:hypothetical protein
MSTLYEIVAELRDFEFEVDEETGEIMNADELDKLELARDTKVENICLLVKNLRSDAAAYKAEKDSFAEKEKRAKNEADRLTDYLQRMLDGATFKSTRASVSYRRSEAVECNMELVPDDYLRYKDPEPDKVKIKNAIKSGIEVDGCCLVENISMQIK